MRDPRTDPRPGDVLKGVCLDGVTRAIWVDSVERGYVYFWRTVSAVEDREQEGEHRRCTLDRWIEDAATAEVVRKGEEHGKEE